ncbi:hypothetical protein D3P96_05335 [Weissella viridescens]|uniref:Uncharacterized protein n=1 Tax=Weissella viridescens TaxID=1629 RepID=A0A3P2RJC8_WEIVI|nr:hypothetical protein [Weissella viridescens]RRG17822.1 hypothetical protein D3P96_05335 [Weissella viridescens]
MGIIDWKSIFSGVAMMITPISAWYLTCKQQHQSVEAYYMDKIVEENAKLHQENDRLAIQVKSLNDELIKMEKSLSVNGLDFEV